MLILELLYLFFKKILKLNVLIMYVMIAHVYVTKRMYGGVVPLHGNVEFCVFSLISFSAIFMIILKTKLHVIAVYSITV